MISTSHKISFSVGTKLILFIGLLLTFFVLFLNLSTIIILHQDKKAYTYQAQSNETILAGREFVSIAKHGMDFLMTALSMIDPRSPINPSQQFSLKKLIDNQNDILLTRIVYVNLINGSITPYEQTEKEKELASLEVHSINIVITQQMMANLLPSLLQKSYAFINLSQSGKVPLLGIVLADKNLKDLPQGMPVVIGVASLKNFGTDLEGSQMTVSDYQGNVLFDMDPTVLYGQQEISHDPLLLAGVESAVSVGVKEYSFENNSFLGSYNKPGLDLIVTTRISWSKAAKATYALIEKFIVLGIFAMGCALLFAILFSKTITAPINKLYEATTQIAQGNFDIHLERKSSDEVGALTNSFNFMLKKINELIIGKMKTVHLENELAIASTVQQNFIPASVYRDPRIEIYSHYQSASACGGDWWGYFKVKDKMCLMIADATGHGLPSALITASARSCFSVIEILAARDPDFILSPSVMLGFANRVVREASQGNIMMTFFIAVIDFTKKTLRYSNAGHNPPWLFKRTGEGYKLQSLILPGPRLGDLGGGAAIFQEDITEIGIDDILFLYTDGLMESTNLAGAQYGKKRVQKFVQSQLALGPEALVKNLIADFLKHNDGKGLDDDLTIAAALMIDPNLKTRQ